MQVQTLANVRQVLPTYRAYHYRVAAARGKAAEHKCDCCRIADAFEWATIHGRDGLSPDDYMPLCRRCHRAYDDLAQKLREFARTRPRNELGRWVALHD
jgi:hypothetical protein